jgi:antitoxin CcdA
LEAALIEIINDKQRKVWKRENETAIEAYNQMVENTGVFSDELRRF